MLAADDGSERRAGRRPPGRSGRRRARGRGPRPRAGRSVLTRPRRRAGVDAGRGGRGRGPAPARPRPSRAPSRARRRRPGRTRTRAGPAAIEPSRISSALVEGIRPPARPRTNRPRQVIVVPAGGRWLWRDAAVAVLAGGRGSWSWLVVVRRAVRMRVRRARPRPPRIRQRRRPSLTSIQPPIATIEIAATTGADRTTTSGGRNPCGADDERGKDEDPERVRDRHRQPEADGVERRPARPDEVGGHQRLAVARRQRVAGAEGGRGQERDEQDERRQVGRCGRSTAGRRRHAARDTGGRRRDRGRSDDRGRAAAPAAGRRRAGPSPPGPPRGAARRPAMSSGGELGPPGVATIATDVSAAPGSAGSSGRRSGAPRRPRSGARRRPPVERHRRAVDDDLAPAEPLGERRVGEVDRVRRGDRRRERRAKPHTIRIVDRPPTPGGKVRPASVSVERPTRRRRPSAPATARAPSQAVTRPASVSSSVTSPSPSVSKSRRAWNVGISAWSMTTSRRIRSGATRMPA